MCCASNLNMEIRLVLIVGLFWRFVQSSSESTPQQPISICGPEKEIHLESQGESSSFTIALNYADENGIEISPPPALCRLRILAPKSHVVYVQFDDENEIENDTEINRFRDTSCTMGIYLPDNSKAPFWNGDPCSTKRMSDIDLLTSDFKILWEPPADNDITVKRKTITLTAVGTGQFCKDPFQHTCMRIGRIPMLCISDHLLCDGVQNCPKSSTNSDEDEKLCKIARNAWENFFVELVKKYKPPTIVPEGAKWDYKVNGSNVPPSEWLNWHLEHKNATQKNEVSNKTSRATESISAMLNKYGPWGYLMMGLLICGTVLFFCGLWECCCKRPKPEIDPPSSSTTPTTVLIMNCEQGLPAGHHQPPNYDDLDLPPSYTTLFPTPTRDTPPSCSYDEENGAKTDEDDETELDNNRMTPIGESVQNINEHNNNNISSASQEQILTNNLTDSGE